MKGLSFRQPWGYAVTHLNKRLENRVWKWLRHGHGKFCEHLKPNELFAIHASSTKPMEVDVAGVKASSGLETLPELADTKGAIIGVASVIDVLRSVDPPLIVEGTEGLEFPHYKLRDDDRERFFQQQGAEQLAKWWLGPFALVLGNVIPLPTPITVAGALGFWEVPKDIEAQIWAQLAKDIVIGEHKIVVTIDAGMPPGVIELRSGDQVARIDTRPAEQLGLFGTPAPTKKTRGLH